MVRVIDLFTKKVIKEIKPKLATTPTKINSNLVGLKVQGTLEGNYVLTFDFNEIGVYALEFIKGECVHDSLGRLLSLIEMVDSNSKK